MKNPIRRTRRNREQGSALVVAVVMLFVIIATIELMLAAPNAELMKVKSTVAKEHAQASAHAGVIDALNWLSAHAQSLQSYLDDPSTMTVAVAGNPTPFTTVGLAAGTSATGKKFVLTSQTANGAINTGAGDGAGTSFPLLSTSSYPDQTGDSTNSGNLWVNISGTRVGLYPFPTFCDSYTNYTGTTSSPVYLTAPNANANFMRYGDPVISHGEYAFRIASLGNSTYEVDVEGRAMGTTQGNTTSPSKFVCRVTAVITATPPNTNDYAPTMLIPASRGTPPAFGTAGAQITMTAPNNPVTGVDQAPGGGPEVAGLVIAQSGVTLSSSSGTPIGNPPINTNPSASALANIDNLVSQVSAAAFKLPNQVGNSGNLYAAKYVGGSLVAGSQVTPQSTIATTYVQITPGENVSLNDLITLHGAPSSDGGVMIVDIGGPGANASSAPITFDSTGLYLFNGNHKFQGTVILYQRAPVNLTNNQLNLADSTGSPGPRGANFQFNSVDIKQALNGIYFPSFKIASYTVFQ